MLPRFLPVGAGPAAPLDWSDEDDDGDALATDCLTVLADRVGTGVDDRLSTETFLPSSFLSSLLVCLDVRTAWNPGRKLGYEAVEQTRRLLLDLTQMGEERRRN